jgi:hypothetical protein
MVTPAAALEHQGTVGVVRVEKFGHGSLALLKMLSPMQAAGQNPVNACHRPRASSFRKPLVDAA